MLLNVYLLNKIGWNNTFHKYRIIVQTQGAYNCILCGNIGSKGCFCNVNWKPSKFTGKFLWYHLKEIRMKETHARCHQIADGARGTETLGAIAVELFAVDAHIFEACLDFGIPQDSSLNILLGYFRMPANSSFLFWTYSIITHYLTYKIKK